MKKYLVILTFIFSICCGMSAFAKNITLYEQPTNTAKVVGTLNSDNGLTPIFTPKNSEWIKVADPTNGNVGWIKSSEINSLNGFSFRIINTGPGAQGYHIMQFVMPQKLSDEQMKTMMKQMEYRQKELQQNLQQMMPNFPVIVPMFMVPQTPSSETTQVVSPKK